jgi:cysteinyl-tRNA synthetase
MHTGFLTMKGEKMAKSTGNTFYVHDLIQNHPGEVLRYALLSAHYRQPLEWSDDIIDQSRRTLDRYYSILRDLKDIDCTAETTAKSAVDGEVIAALNDDLNTPLAFAALSALSKHHKTKADLKKSLLATGKLMGFLQSDPEAWFKFGLEKNQLQEDEINALIAERSQAKKNKDYQKADAIRAHLLNNHVQIEDTAQGTIYKIIS